HYPATRVDSKAVNWAVQEITAFIQQEEKRGPDLADDVMQDPGFEQRLNAETNLLRRIMCADPPPNP
ncbi:MAG: hypothetical protein PHU85_20665, partial [Phycisphaerae bacterium]|nr:hypothetical protein [Phycisphaerae bacterium]